MYLVTTKVWKGRAEGGREVLRRAMTAYQRAGRLPRSVHAEPPARDRREPSAPTGDPGRVCLSEGTGR